MVGREVLPEGISVPQHLLKHGVVIPLGLSVSDSEFGVLEGGET